MTKREQANGEAFIAWAGENRCTLGVEFLDIYRVEDRRESWALWCREPGCKRGYAIPKDGSRMNVLNLFEHAASHKPDDQA